MNEGKVCALIVNYCGFGDTIEAVSSLVAGDVAPDQIILLDNNSPDGSGERLSRFYRGCSRIRVILLKDNIGFGGANNVGMDIAFSNGHDYALLINNDTYASKALLSNLLKSADENSVSVPLICYYSKRNTIWYGGGRFDRFMRPLHNLNGLSVEEVNLEVEDVDFATGCCLLIHRDIYLKVGGFDENYFLYWEDADLSIRMKRKGIRILFQPKAVLFHKVSASTGGDLSPIAFYYDARNRLYGIDKLHLGIIPKAVGIFRILLRVPSNKGRYRFAINALVDYLNGRLGKATVQMS